LLLFKNKIKVERGRGGERVVEKNTRATPKLASDQQRTVKAWLL